MKWKLIFLIYILSIILCIAKIEQKHKMIDEDIETILCFMPVINTIVCLYVLFNFFNEVKDILTIENDKINLEIIDEEN